VNGVKIRFHRCVASRRFLYIDILTHNGTDRTTRVPGMFGRRFNEDCF
jgi:hypothetical protein